MRRVPLWALVSSIAAPVLLIGGFILAAAIQPVPFDSVMRTISDLAAHDTPERWVMTTALAGVGVSHVVTACGLSPAAMAGRLLLGVGGLATVLVAAFPLPAVGVDSSAHTAAAAVSFISLSVWPAFAWTRLQASGWAGGTLLTPRVSAAATAALLLALGWFLLERRGNGELVGLAERAAAGGQALWPLAVVLSARRAQTRGWVSETRG